MYYYFIAVYLVTLFLLTSLLIFLPVNIILRITISWFDRRLAVIHWLTCLWVSLYTWLSPIWKVSITGLENVDRKKAYILACNHQSMLDILILFRTFLHFKWVSKAAIFKVPIIGWNLWLCNHIKIERSSTKSQRKMLRKSAEHIRRGSSILIFPEGTRARDGQLRPFKEGAFLIALQEKTDIVPMVIDDSYKALPLTGIMPRKKQATRLHVMPPVPYETFKEMTVRQLSEHIHSIIAAELERMRS